MTHMQLLLRYGRRSLVLRMDPDPIGSSPRNPISEWGREGMSSASSKMGSAPGQVCRIFTYHDAESWKLKHGPTRLASALVREAFADLARQSGAELADLNAQE